MGDFYMGGSAFCMNGNIAVIRINGLLRSYHDFSATFVFCGADAKSLGFSGFDKSGGDGQTQNLAAITA